MTRAEKQSAIKEYTEQVAQNTLVFFKMLELETHIEAMIINGDEQYVLRFQKVVDGKIFNGEDNQFLFTKDQVAELILADRKDAAESATAYKEPDLRGGEWVFVDKDSILNRPLPKELTQK